MRYGLTLPNAGACASARVLAELAEAAEAAGWDAVFLEDYIVHHSGRDVPTIDPWVALAAMALRTERIRLGTAVTPLSRRRPWKVARETVTLDQLCGGRLILGVGLGDTGDPGFGAVGEATDNRTRARMLDEALAVLVGLWSGEPFHFAGEHYTIGEMTCLPRPVQSPRIPIWVGGNWPHAGVMRRAARWDGFMGGKEHAPEEPWMLTPDELRALKAAIDGYREPGRGAYEIVLGGAERDEDWDRQRAAVRELAAAGATWWMEYAYSGGLEAILAAVMRGPLRVE